MEKLKLGDVVITRSAQRTLNLFSVEEAITRHLNCDWGNVCEEDRNSNDEALKNNERILSVYQDVNGVTFWIITEWDRSYTTILLPSEY